MTIKQSVLEALKKQKETAHSADVISIKNEWIEALNALFSKITDWLNEAVEQKLLEVKRDWTILQDERLGIYSAPLLEILIHSGITAQFQPKARFAAGTKGRVDMECMPNKVILVRKETDSWSIAELDAPRGWKFKPLTEDSFWEIMGNILG